MRKSGLKRNTVDDIVGTRHWLPQLLGNWSQDDLVVQTAPKHELPKKVMEQVPESWDQRMRQVGQEIGQENVDWRIVDAEPYAKLEVKRGDDWGLRMFAGDQTRIEDYFLKDGKINLVHSPANYAESLATNNTDPWGLIKQYGGRTGLADGHAVSVAITALDRSGNEVIQFFRRGDGLGEYGGYIGTAAGNSMKPEMSPFDVAYREGVEESRVLPFFGAYNASFHEAGILPNLVTLKEYERIGLSSSGFEVIERIQGGSIVRYEDRKGIESRALLVTPDTEYKMTGLALNIDSDDNDTEGKNKPHHKSEYLFMVRTKLPLDAINDPELGWIRNDEHADVMYVPFNQRDLTDFAVDNFMEMMPPTNAVVLAAIRNEFGQEAFTQALDETNRRYPIAGDHPLISVLEDGSYQVPKIIQLD